MTVGDGASGAWEEIATLETSPESQMGERAMATGYLTSDWAVTFDWQQAGASAYDSSALAQRLLAALQEREPLLDRLDTSEEAARFGRYVTALRRARGWTRPTLAEQAGIDPVAVALLEEAGLTSEELSERLVQQVAGAFGIPANELAVHPSPQAAEATVPQPGGFGAWLRPVLQPLLAPARIALRAQYLGATRGGAPAAPREVLTSPLPLPEQTVTLPDGRQARMVPTLEPGIPPEPGAADLLVHVLDNNGNAVPDVTVVLELEGLPFESLPSDSDGMARIEGIPFDMAFALPDLELRVLIEP